MAQRIDFSIWQYKNGSGVQACAAIKFLHDRLLWRHVFLQEIMLIIDGAVAWRNAVQHECQWVNTVDRLTGTEVYLSVRKKFDISRSDKFFCIGSCFARNIEEHLIYCGLNVLSKNLVCPKEEWPYRPNGIVNKFTTASILNEVRWSLLDSSDACNGLAEDHDGWHDAQLCPGAPPVSQDRARERRNYIVREYFSRLREADVIVITLGLIETWYDAESKLFLNKTPSKWQVSRNPGRYSVHVTTFDQNLAALEETRSLIHEQNSAARIIVTVSPVPMTVTFTGNDVIVSTNHSKSVLRAVAGEFAQRHANVAYFPSYEMITLSNRDVVCAQDNLHIKDSMVGKVVRTFLDCYVPDVSYLAEGFSEYLYLLANPDVEACVREGGIDSGFAHWLIYGRGEGRAIAPSVIPEWLVHLGLAQ